MVLDLLTIAGLPTAVGASEAVHQQQLLDEKAEAPERQEPFYLDVYCDAQSRKKEEVHGTIIVLKDGKVRPSHTRAMRNTLTSTCSFDYGRKIPKLVYRKKTLTAERRLTPSQASSTPSQPKTSAFLTDPCPHLPSWGS